MGSRRDTGPTQSLMVGPLLLGDKLPSLPDLTFRVWDCCCCSHLASCRKSLPKHGTESAKAERDTVLGHGLSPWNKSQLHQNSFLTFIGGSMFSFAQTSLG